MPEAHPIPNGTLCLIVGDSLVEVLGKVGTVIRYGRMGYSVEGTEYIGYHYSVVIPGFPVGAGFTGWALFRDELLPLTRPRAPSASRA